MVSIVITLTDEHKLFFIRRIKQSPLWHVNIGIRNFLNML